MPEIIEMGENLGMDLRASDVIDISQNAQNPPPQDKSRIRMPTSQRPPSNDADIIGKTLTAVCRIRDSFGLNAIQITKQGRIYL